MLKTIHDFYTYEFNEEDGITAAYFKTKSDTPYRVYFYPARDYFENLLNPEDFIYKNGFFFGFTKIGEFEDKKEPLDVRVMNTITNIVTNFYASEGIESILIFHCSDHWGNDKKLKRANSFNYWFLNSHNKEDYNKFDETLEITSIDEQTGDIEIIQKEYLSLIFSKNNESENIVKEEFLRIKDFFSYNK